MDVDRIADRLYGLPPEEFTAARLAAEKEVRASGDKDLAARVHSLRRPTAPAWLANQLVREHHDEITALLELGAGMREATAALSGPQLRELGQQRRRVIGALVSRARSDAVKSGRAVAEATARGLEDTLNAALADPDAADALLAGRLTEALSPSGFAGLTAADASVRKSSPPAPTAAPQRSTPPAVDELSVRREAARRAAERESADRAVRETERIAKTAAAWLESTRQQLQSAKDTARKTADEIDRLKTALAQAETADVRAQEAVRAAESELSTAHAASERADADAATALEHRRAVRETPDA